MKNSTKQNLVGKDFINIGVYTVLLMVVTFVVSIPFMPFMAVTYPLMAGACALFSAPIFMLMTYKVAKRGTLLLCTVVFGIIYVFMGYVTVFPIAILSGLLCEAVMWKQGSYRSFRHNLVSFSIFSSLFYVGGTFIPIYILGPEYYMSLPSNSSYFLIEIQYATSPLLATFTVVVTVVMAIVGCFIGRQLLRKHFMKAGLISKE